MTRPTLEELKELQVWFTQTPSAPDWFPAIDHVVGILLSRAIAEEEDRGTKNLALGQLQRALEPPIPEPPKLAELTTDRELELLRKIESLVGEVHRLKELAERQVGYPHHGESGPASDPAPAGAPPAPYTDEELREILGSELDKHGTCALANSEEAYAGVAAAMRRIAQPRPMMPKWDDLGERNQIAILSRCVQYSPGSVHLAYDAIRDALIPATPAA